MQGGNQHQQLAPRTRPAQVVDEYMVREVKCGLMLPLGQAKHAKLRHLIEGRANRTSE
jgi:hypothetical protein